MKKYLVIMSAVLLFAGLSGCSYDDSDLKNSINALENKVAALEAKVNQMNNEIGSIKSLVDALEADKKITGVTSTATGYTIAFNDGTSITLNHGANGADAPVVGVREDGGVYYWTLTINGETDWLTDAQDKKLPVSGKDPVIDVDEDGYWTVNGEQINGADGNPVKALGEDGDSFFTDVTDGDNAVTFTLTNGTVIVIPKVETLSLTLGTGNSLFLKYGETGEYDFALSGIGSVIITKPDGWQASVSSGKLSVTAPPAENTFAEKDGDISITVVGNKTTVNKTFAVSARDYNYVIDFEDPRVLDYLAGPTSKGENLYDGYAEQYIGYDDDGSGLFMMINYDDYVYEAYNYWNGGTAISQWNDMTTPGDGNHCSVYYNDPVTGKGGYKGSATFAVTYLGFMGTPPEISFLNAEMDTDYECVFDHFYVTNNTYAALSMQNGDDFAKKFGDGDWFKLVIEGFNKSGTSTGKVEFYLADFRTPTSPGIITEWTPVDLSTLGSVAAIQFDLQSSDTGAWGMNTPAYFCFDNLAIKK